MCDRKRRNVVLLWHPLLSHRMKSFIFFLRPKPNEQKLKSFSLLAVRPIEQIAMNPLQKQLPPKIDDEKY
jgi:hypothetical protein